MTRPHAALLCRHTAPTLPHIAAALAPSSPLCACGRELHGANYVDGRRPASSTCTVAEDAAGRVGILPTCAARASQAAWIAPAEPPASGEAQCADGEVREERGSARVAELGERSTDPDPENVSSDHVFTAEMV